MGNKKINVNDAYELLTELVNTEKASHTDVMVMFADFIGDTLMIKVELELSKKDIKLLEAAKRAVLAASLIKIGEDE